jgi:hypothetical protein
MSWVWQSYMTHVYLVLASMSDPCYFGLGWPPGPRTLDLVGALGMISMSDPHLLRSSKHVWPTFTWTWLAAKFKRLESGNMSNPRYLGLAIMSDPRFFFFCNGQHDFLESERGGREKTSIRAPLWAASAHAPHHCVCGGEAHRMPPRKATLSSILKEHAPSKWRRQRLPASTCSTRICHFWI